MDQAFTEQLVCARHRSEGGKECPRYWGGLTGEPAAKDLTSRSAQGRRAQNRGDNVQKWDQMWSRCCRLGPEVGRMWRRQSLDCKQSSILWVSLSEKWWQIHWMWLQSQELRKELGVPVNSHMEKENMEKNKQGFVDMLNDKKDNGSSKHSTSFLSWILLEIIFYHLEK